MSNFGESKPRMKMSVRLKFWSVILFVIVVGLLIGSLFAASDHMPYVFFGWILIGNVLAFRVRCPNCGTSVSYQGKRTANGTYYAGSVNRQCMRCGCDFTKAYCD